MEPSAAVAPSIVRHEPAGGLTSNATSRVVGTEALGERACGEAAMVLGLEHLYELVQKAMQLGVLPQPLRRAQSDSEASPYPLN